MKPFRSSLTTSFLASALTLASAAMAQAAPRQMVLIVAEGLNPQTIEIGTRYVKKAAGDDENASGVAALRTQGASGAAPAEPVASLKGLLASAKASGYRTGLVSTGDVSRDAAMLLGTPEGDTSALSGPGSPDVLEGGGRASFSAEQRAALGQGNTMFENGAAFEQADAAVKGKLIALQAESDLSYAIDRDPESQAGLADMASLAIDTLAGKDDAPFLLVVHDTLLGKALQQKDTPAAFEQFKELDSIVSDVLTRRGDKSSLGVALLAGGGTLAPRANGDESNALFIVSGLQKSFGGAGKYLQGADAARLTQFAEQDYAGWAITEAQRTALLAGTLDGEAAVRASYEPAIGITFEPVASAPTLYALGVPAELSAITNFASTPPAAR